MRICHHLFIALVALICTVSSSAARAECPLDPGREAGVAEEVRLTVFEGEALDIELPGGGETATFFAVYYEGRPDLKPLVITHGPGQTLASHFMTDLSLSLSELGYPVLALQMPLLKRECEGADHYPSTFSGGFERINAAAAWLRNGYAQSPVLVGHWVANAYFEQEPDAPFDTWIMPGITGSLSSTGDNYPRILDIYGGKGHPMTLRWAWLRRFWLWLAPGSRQVKIDGADQAFNGRMADVAIEIDRFIKASSQEK